MRKAFYFNLMFVILSVFLLSCSATWSQAMDEPPVASATDGIDNFSKAGMGSPTAAGDEPEEEKFDLVQTEETTKLEEAIDIFNERFAPKRITTINEKVILELIEAQILNIDRTEIGPYSQMILGDEHVFIKEKKKPEPEEQVPDTLTGDDKHRTLDSSLKNACDEMENNQTRGSTKGNKKPEANFKLIPRTITIRDQNNKLKRITIYSPPRFPPSKSKIAGERGKQIKDFATSILVPKNPVNKGDESVFDDMPSADTWIDEGAGQSQ